MTSRVMSCATLGVDAYIVTIETDIDRKVPAFFVVGLPDNAVRESRDRGSRLRSRTQGAFFRTVT